MISGQTYFILVGVITLTFVLGAGYWFIINSRNKPVYGKNEHNLHQLRPICSKCLDEIGIEDNYVNW